MFLILNQWPDSKPEKVWSKVSSWFVRQDLKDSDIVTQVLLSGLREKGSKFLFNDYSVQEAVETIVVFDDVQSLRWAIEQKQKGLVKRLMAGPFITRLPSDARTLLFTAPIDAFIFSNRDLRDQFLRLSPKSPRATYVWSQGPEKFLEMIQGEQPPAVPLAKRQKTMLIAL